MSEDNFGPGLASSDVREWTCPMCNTVADGTGHVPNEGPAGWYAVTTTQRVAEFESLDSADSDTTIICGACEQLLYDFLGGVRSDA